MGRPTVTLPWLIASGAGTGLVPIAPGTVASLVAVLTGAAMLLLSHWLLAGAALLATIGGACALYLEPVHDDPAWVVIDEYAGQWIALLGLAAAEPLGVLAAFVLFRLLDILKPGPIGWADRQDGVFGLMADDIIAGVIAALLLWGGHALLLWVGVRGA
jgi:phosphatidylglycerophosphatase A